MVRSTCPEWILAYCKTLCQLFCPDELEAAMLKLRRDSAAGASLQIGRPIADLNDDYTEAGAQEEEEEEELPL